MREPLSLNFRNQKERKLSFMLSLWEPPSWHIHRITLVPFTPRLLLLNPQILIHFSLPHFLLSPMYNLRTSKPPFLHPIPVFCLLLVLLLFSLPHFPPKSKTHFHLHQHLQVAHSTCEGTLYPGLCVSTLASFPDLASKSFPKIISSVLNYTVYEVKSSSHNCSGLRQRIRNLDPLEHRALDDCLELFDDTVEELHTTIADLSNTIIGSKRYHDLQTLLSGAMTNLYTCLDGFAYTQGNVRNKIQDRLFLISRQVSNSLAMLKKVPALKKTSSSEVFPEYGNTKHGFPSWMASGERKLLEATANETRFDLLVAKDGTGNFTSIGEAVDAAPNSSTTRHSLYLII